MIDTETPNSELNQGFVYLINCDEMPTAFKIGKTAKNPYVRIAELSAASGVPVNFELICAIFVSDCEYIEGYLHDYFENERINPLREFFRFDDADKAKERFIYAVSEKNEFIDILGFENEWCGFDLTSMMKEIHKLQDKNRELEKKIEQLNLDKNNLLKKAVDLQNKLRAAADASYITECENQTLKSQRSNEHYNTVLAESLDRFKNICRDNPHDTGTQILEKWRTGRINSSL